MILARLINLSKVSRFPVASLQCTSGTAVPISELCRQFSKFQSQTVKSCKLCAWKLHPTCPSAYQFKNGSKKPPHLLPGELTNSNLTLQTDLSVSVNRTPLSLEFDTDSFKFNTKKRTFSTNSSNFRGDVNSSDEIEWTHPAARTEDAFQGDPELRSLLSETAEDFGRSSRRESTESKETVADEELVSITTEQDELSRIRDSLSPPIAARSSGETSVVFSIDSLVDILREENARDICVIKVPPEKNYVDYFVVVTGRSTRHLSAMTQYINKLYKKNKRERDPFVGIEGKLTDDWMCIDFGNIIVHFMLEETRALYDLETLWIFGREFDDHIRQWEQHEILLFNPETDDVHSPAKD